MSKRRNGKVNLGDFVRNIREGRRLSLKDVERNSLKGVSSGYISQLENGVAENLTVDKLSALAKGLGLGRPGTDELFAVARGVVPPEGFNESWFFELYEMYKNLLEQRHVAAVDALVQDLLTLLNNGLEDLNYVIKSYPKKKGDGPNNVEAIRRNNG